MGYHAFRLTAKSVISFICVLAILAVGTVLLTSDDPLTVPALGIFQRGIPGGTEAERMAFLTENGWQADETPLGTQEVTIPAQFDEVYEQYNAIQQGQGFNLEKYAGKPVTEYTYHITNYPENDEVVAHLLVYKDKIIGADVSAMEQGGFVEPVKKPAQ